MVLQTLLYYNFLLYYAFSFWIHHVVQKNIKQQTSTTVKYDTHVNAAVLLNVMLRHRIFKYKVAHFFRMSYFATLDLLSQYNT